MKTLPQLSIQQTIDFHKSMHAKKPSFGMDIFEEDFCTDGFVILENNGKGNSNTYSRCGHFILILGLSGGAIRHVNQHTYITQEHTLHLLVPGVIHSFENTGSHPKFLLLFFDRDFLFKELDELIQFHSENSEFVDLSAVEFSKVLSLYEELNLENTNRDINCRELSKSLVTQLLYLLRRLKLSKSKEVKHNRSEIIINEFLNLIEENFQKKRHVQDYAQVLKVTPKHLSETVKKGTTKSALSFIHKRQIKEIQYLLIFSDKSIKQIAFLLNFESSSDLGRFFKRNIGLSPKNYQLYISSL